MELNVKSPSSPLKGNSTDVEAIRTATAAFLNSYLSDVAYPRGPPFSGVEYTFARVDLTVAGIEEVRRRDDGNGRKKRERRLLGLSYSPSEGEDSGSEGGSSSFYYLRLIFVGDALFFDDASYSSLAPLPSRDELDLHRELAFLEGSSSLSSFVDRLRGAAGGGNHNATNAITTRSAGSVILVAA